MNIENCKIYDIENIDIENKLECKFCEDNYQLIELTCLQCTIEHCKKCKSKSICEECSNNLIWEDESC